MRSSMLNKLVLGGFVLTAASAWNFEIHNQIGFIAEQFMTEPAKYVVEQILDDQFDGSIGKCAHWADTVSKTTHRYSYNWHWISAHDDPPNFCNVHYHRDCDDKVSCVVGQLANQTRILGDCLELLRDGKIGKGKPNVMCQEALKWVTHFVGDMHEPMHTSYNDLGGNTFRVKFNGTTTNMHQTWDRWIIYASTGKTSFSQKHIEPDFQDIADQIRADGFATRRDSWLKDLDWQRPINSGVAWAREANALVCDYVFGRYVNGSDLYLENNYTENAFPIIRQQIARAGLRLAGWMNAQADVFYNGNEQQHSADL